MKTYLLKIILISVFIIDFTFQGTSQNNDPIVSNVLFSQRSDGSGMVDITYNVTNTDGGNVFITVKASNDDGITWDYPIIQVSGDISNVSPGDNKHIVWSFAAEHPNTYSEDFRIKVIANIHGQPCTGMPTITDIDGNTYNTVQIGDQCWMKENLNTTRDANGNNIMRYCYSNNTNNCDNYGGLYTWATVMNGAASSNGNPSGVQGICPNGWHVPSDAEWTQLTDCLINTYSDINADNVGNKLKSCRQVSSPLGGDCNTSDHPRWNSHSTHYGTNDFGFSSLPGGRYYGYSYNSLGSYGYWWSSTQYSSTDAWDRVMTYGTGGVYRTIYPKTAGYSVRCLRD